MTARTCSTPSGPRPRRIISAVSRLRIARWISGAGRAVGLADLGHPSHHRIDRRPVGGEERRALVGDRIKLAAAGFRRDPRVARSSSRVKVG